LQGRTHKLTPLLTLFYPSTSYDYSDCASFLTSSGADGSIRNWEGFPASHGIEGERNPNDPLVLLEICNSTAAALKALKMIDDVTNGENDVDKSQLAIMGMQVKKGNKALAKEDWTADCQTLFTGIMKKL